MKTIRSTGIVIVKEVIMHNIYFIRKQKVMLDKDLARLYGVTTKRLREQVRRNFDNFPDNFMFFLNEKEIDLMVSQNAVVSKRNLAGSSPMAFTEHGVLMLSNVLKSKLAIKVSIRIIEVFIRLREMLIDYTDLRLAFQKLEKTTENNTKNIEVVFKYFDELLKNKMQVTPRKKMGYKIPVKKTRRTSK